MGTLNALADLVFTALTAQLPRAAQSGIDRLGERAAQTNDCRELLGSLRSMVDIIRYGKARATDSDTFVALFKRVATQGAIQLHYAARGLDLEASRAFSQILSDADAAIRLADINPELTGNWTDALRKVAYDDKAARLVMGAASRLLYESEALTPEAATVLLERMLSPGTSIADAAAFFEGFFEGGGQRLLYDAALRNCVDVWLISLDDDTFTEHLPLFRRVLSALDKTEKARLLDTLFGRRSSATGRVLSEHADALWPTHFEALKTILTKGAHDG